MKVWVDSTGRVWVSEWNSGRLAMYDPAGEVWGAASALDQLVVVHTATG